MARTRNIKPGFFKNEDLADLPPLVRLVFAGLWCWADRDGRLEDRPRRLKAEILPFDDADMDGILGQLAEAGFIVRYDVDGNHYIAIPTFSAHQNPHCAEKSAGYPPPPEQVQGESDVSTMQAPCEYSADTVQASDEHSSSRALTLNPSPNLLVPSPNHLNPQTSEPADAGEESDAKKSKRKPAEEIQIPSELDTPDFRDAWARWLAYRRERRLTMTKMTLDGQLKKLAASANGNAVEWIEVAITSGWQGLFEPRSTNGRQQSGRAPVGPGQRHKDADYGKEGTF